MAGVDFNSTIKESNKYKNINNYIISIGNCIINIIIIIIIIIILIPFKCNIY